MKFQRSPLAAPRGLSRSKCPPNLEICPPRGAGTPLAKGKGVKIAIPIFGAEGFPPV